MELIFTINLYRFSSRKRAGGGSRKKSRFQTCGQEFYFETIRDFINCIHCGKQYEVKDTHVELATKDMPEAGD